MISHGKELKVFAGNSNPALAEAICQSLNMELGKSEAKSFADGECSISVYEPVRGCARDGPGRGNGAAQRDCGQRRAPAQGGEKGLIFWENFEKRPVPSCM